VIAIKTTVYRTSDESPLVPALIEASDNGKQTVCLVELKARFDERRNIEWSRALERSGVHVVYGFPTLKTHAKMTLVVRREANGLQRYVHIGTGNYHALTARGYEDFGLFTTDENIAADVSDLFNYMTGFGRPQRFRTLLVAPFTLRTRLIEAIRSVAQVAESGKKARIRMKVNSLTDEDVIEALYDASSAGAAIDIVCRSICSLRPGVKGLSENIHVRSVVGRFLEHSRVFVLEAGDKDDVPHGQLRPDAAKPRSPARSGRPGRRHPCTPACERDVRCAPVRQHELVGAPRQRIVEAPAAQEGRPPCVRAGPAHAERRRTCPPHRLQTELSSAMTTCPLIKMRS
jgi:polyphosphate kinase